MPSGHFPALSAWGRRSLSQLACQQSPGGQSHVSDDAVTIWYGRVRLRAAAVPRQESTMRHTVSHLVSIGAAVVALQSPARAQVPQGGAADAKITEWTVPWPNSRPRDPYMDATGHVWFVGQEGNYVARLEPATGKFSRFEIDPGTNPHNLIVDAKGR